MNKLAFTTRIAVDYSRENFSFKGILEFKQVTKSASGSKNSKLTKWYIFCLKRALKLGKDLPV